MSIYCSPQGKELILELYDQNWAGLCRRIERKFIPTRYGNTHLVVTRTKDAILVVVFHGGNVISPISFAWITQLTGRYRIYAPDTVGHPGYSAEARLKPGTIEVSNKRDGVVHIRWYRRLVGNRFLVRPT